MNFFVQCLMMLFILGFFYFSSSARLFSRRTVLSSVCYFYLKLSAFLPRNAMDKRGLCRHVMSVCLCVCHITGIMSVCLSHHCYNVCLSLTSLLSYLSVCHITTIMSVCLSPKCKKTRFSQKLSNLELDLQEIEPVTA